MIFSPFEFVESNRISQNAWNPSSVYIKVFVSFYFIKYQFVVSLQDTELSLINKLYCYRPFIYLFTFLFK